MLFLKTEVETWNNRERRDSRSATRVFTMNRTPLKRLVLANSIFEKINANQSFNWSTFFFIYSNKKQLFHSREWSACFWSIGFFPHDKIKLDKIKLVNERSLNIERAISLWIIYFATAARVEDLSGASFCQFGWRPTFWQATSAHSITLIIHSSNIQSCDREILNNLFMKILTVLSDEMTTVFGLWETRLEFRKETICRDNGKIKN